jgi:hypothetical protein
MVVSIQYIDGASYYNQAYRWLRIKHIVYDNGNGKNIMERAIQYINKG